MANAIKILNGATEIGYGTPIAQGSNTQLNFTAYAANGVWQEGTEVTLYKLSSATSNVYIPINVTFTSNNSKTIDSIGIGYYVVAEVVSLGTGQTPITVEMASGNVYAGYEVDVVDSLNGLTGDLELTGSNGIIITPNMDTIDISLDNSDLMQLTTSPIENDILLTDDTGQAIDSGVSISTDATFLADSDSLIPTQKAVKTYVDASTTSAYNLRGGWDASGGLFPATGGTGTGGAVEAGNLWIITVAGTLGGNPVEVNDTIIALIDTPGQTGANWAIDTNTVLSVNSQTGIVVLTTSDINEGSNLYYTDPRAIAAPLTGYTTGSNAAISATDTVLQAFGKTQGQLDNKQALNTNLTTLSNANLSISATLTAPRQLTLPDADSITVQSGLAPTNNFVRGISQAGVLSYAQPSYSNLSGNGSTSITTLGTITTGAWNGSTIANNYLQNYQITINSNTVDLGGSVNITANTPNALTVSTGLQLNTGTTFDGSVAKTISIDGTVTTLTGIQTLTNKTLTAPVINSPTGITKTDVGLGNVENTALSTWAGSTNITTLGTIGTGVWNGTAIAIANGGTGATSSANALTNLGLGTGSTPVFQGLKLTSVSASRAVVTDASNFMIPSSTTATQLGYLSGATGTTGTGSLVFATSPTFTTPVLGVATATSINGLTITPTTANLTLASGSTFFTLGAHSTNLNVTADTNLTLPTTGTLATLAGTEALTNKTLNGLTITSSTGTLTIANGKSLTANSDFIFNNGGVAGTPTLQVASNKQFVVNNTMTFSGTDSASVLFGIGGTVAYTGGTLAQFAATTSAQLAGVISDETGSGALVFATSPTLVTPVLGAASATSINKVSITAPATGATLTLADGSTWATASLTLANNSNEVSYYAYYANSSGYIRSVLGLAINQNSSTTAYYTKLATIQSNDSHLRISGFIGGQAVGQGTCDLNMSITSRNGVIALTGSALGAIFSGDILIYIDGSNNLTVYLKTVQFAESCLDLSFSGSINSSGNQITIATPTTSTPSGTLAYTLSTRTGSGATLNDTMLFSDTSGNLSGANNALNSLNDILINTTGKAFKAKRGGANSIWLTGGTMVLGVVTFNTTAVSTGDFVGVMKTANGGTNANGMPAITIVNGTSVTLTGPTTDTSTWDIFIIKQS